MYCFLIVCTCVHVLMFAIEGEQLEPEFGFEAEEPVPEIFTQQEFVPEGKSCSTPLVTILVPTTFTFLLYPYAS